MTNYSFATHENKIINIGTAGGQTKGSSGYTFRFIQKHSAAIARSLAESGKPSFYSTSKNRFHFYDSILLYILNHRQLEGREIFERLFNKNKVTSVLKFLDNETSLIEDLSIIKSLPTVPFLNAALRQIGSP
jgi:lycopene beta-cyclase